MSRRVCLCVFFIGVGHFVAFFFLILLSPQLLFLVLFFVLILVFSPVLILRGVHSLGRNKRIVGLSAIFCFSKRLVLLRRHHPPFVIFRKAVLTAEMLDEVPGRSGVLGQQAKAISSARTWLKTAAIMLVFSLRECSCRCKV